MLGGRGVGEGAGFRRSARVAARRSDRAPRAAPRCASRSVSARARGRLVVGVTSRVSSFATLTPASDRLAPSACLRSRLPSRRARCSRPRAPRSAAHASPPVRREAPCRGGAGRAGPRRGATSAMAPASFRDRPLCPVRDVAAASLSAPPVAAVWQGEAERYRRVPHGGHSAAGGEGGRGRGGRAGRAEEAACRMGGMRPGGARQPEPRGRWRGRARLDVATPRIAPARGPTRSVHACMYRSRLRFAAHPPPSPPPWQCDGILTPPPPPFFLSFALSQILFSGSGTTTSL